MEASTLEQAAPQILQTICENLGWDVGGLWHLDRRAEVLRCAEIWNVPGLDIKEFKTASLQLTFARGAGLPGRIWSSGQPAWIHDVVQDANFPRSPAAAKAGLHGAFGFPVQVGNEMGAVIELFGREPRVPDDSLLLIVASLGSQIGQFFQRERSEVELDEMHKQLVDTSRQAGMAEVATSVLHNVGNVLNSVNVSSTLVSNQVRKSKAGNLSKVVALLNEHATNLGAYLTNDPKGKQLPGYLGQLAEHLLGEQATALKELQLLHENIEHIKDIVVMQQGYAKISGLVETVKITDLVEDAIRLNLGALQRHGVEVIREYEDLPPVDVEKHKILQILVNLVGNAKYACDESHRTNKQMTLRVTRSSDQVKISVRDNGIGIPPENLTRIFNHGFTTRKEGHGFGLHSAVLAAMEMGGALKVHSDGPNKGATFTLEFPYKPHKNSQNDHES
jgi:signal transduction histidine kinase